MSTATADEFLGSLSSRLSNARTARAHGGGGGRPRRPVQRRLAFCQLSERSAERLMRRLDCDRHGNSVRTGKPSWPESWDIANGVARALGADVWMVLVLASWLEGQAPTTRRTYAYGAQDILRDLRVYGLDELLALPLEAGLTWQRTYARQHMPRTTNTQTGILNSLMRHAARLGVQAVQWEPIPNVRVTRGRHIDRDGVVLTAQELLRYWHALEGRPQRQVLALMLASLHGLRACEVASLRWGDMRYARRGEKAAPAVLHIIGKGGKKRMVQVHAAMRPWLEANRREHGGDEFVVADERGDAPSPQVVSWWAKEIFRRAEIVGYAHALRATWATLALENRSNSPLEVQTAGGWKNQETMLGHYATRLKAGRVRLFGARN
jgi:integrase